MIANFFWFIVVLMCLAVLFYLGYLFYLGLCWTLGDLPEVIPDKPKGFPDGDDYDTLIMEYQESMLQEDD